MGIKSYCWWFGNLANQLRLVVYPIIYKVLYIPDHPRWCRISSINSIYWKPLFAHLHAHQALWMSWVAQARVQADIETKLPKDTDRLCHSFQWDKNQMSNAYAWALCKITPPPKTSIWILEDEVHVQVFKWHIKIFTPTKSHSKQDVLKIRRPTKFPCVIRLLKWIPNYPSIFSQ